MSKSEFYLECPYAEKDEAKALGARWDGLERKWYVPQGGDRNLFKKWWPANVSQAREVAQEAPF